MKEDNVDIAVYLTRGDRGLAGVTQTSAGPYSVVANPIFATKLVTEGLFRCTFQIYTIDKLVHGSIFKIWICCYCFANCW